MPTGAGLRPGAKATEHPPDPTGGAPVLDPTDEAGAGNVPTGAGLPPGAKATEHPPDPIGGAPVLDPTDERRLETEPRRGVRHRHRESRRQQLPPSAYRHRASRRLYPPPANNPGSAGSSWSGSTRVVRWCYLISAKAARSV